MSGPVDGGDGAGGPDVRSGGPDPEDVRRDDEPAFEEPWQARAFAVAVQLTERGEGDLPWEDFQARLVEEIEADGDEVEDADAAEATEDVYYEQWLRALERLLVEEGFLSEDELTERAREFESGERDAAVFVIGEPGHGHGHSHDHVHGHDHHHDHPHGRDHDDHEH